MDLSKIPAGMAKGIENWVATPGNLLDKTTPQMPQSGTWSDVDEAKRQIEQANQSNQETDWASGTALGMLGMKGVRFRMPKLSLLLLRIFLKY